jgi:large subunit ribosomal protein L6
VSRIGKQPIPIPSGVEVKQDGDRLFVKGPKGSLEGPIPAGISLELGDSEVRFSRADDGMQARSLHGLARALAANMVTGVTTGFSKELEIQGIGYRAEMKGKQLNLLLGFSHPVLVDVPEGLSVSLDGNTKIVVSGIDKQQVGQFAADIRAFRPPEPYKGKGVRYRGEHVRRKVGKAAGAAAGG